MTHAETETPAPMPGDSAGLLELVGTGQLDHRGLIPVADHQSDDWSSL